MSELICALCMYSRTEPLEAVTVMRGMAVCEEHAAYAQGAEFSQALVHVRREEA